MAEEGYPCWILTWQPCDYLLEQILNAFACCLGLCDSFSHPREPYQDQAADDGTDQTTALQVGEDGPPSPRAAARRRPQKPPTSEGPGGQIH